jgi:hypothetical protein
MFYFVTTLDIYCDDFASQYTTKFFRTREALEAYVVTLDDTEVHSMGGLSEQEQEYYQRLIPF